MSPSIDFALYTIAAQSQNFHFAIHDNPQISFPFNFTQFFWPYQCIFKIRMFCSNECYTCLHWTSCSKLLPVIQFIEPFTIHLAFYYQSINLTTTVLMPNSQTIMNKLNSLSPSTYPCGTLTAHCHCENYPFLPISALFHLSDFWSIRGPVHLTHDWSAYCYDELPCQQRGQGLPTMLPPSTDNQRLMPLCMAVTKVMAIAASGVMY